MKQRRLTGRRKPFLRALGFALFVACITQAHGEVVVIVAKGAAGALTKEQVADVFLGKITTLPGGNAAVLVDQPGASQIRDEFYTKFTGKSSAQAKAYWAKLGFTGKGTPPTELGGNAEVRAFVAATPGSIGYIEKATVDDSVKVVSGN